jgi:hypothetical protein
MSQTGFIYQESRRSIRLGWKRPVRIVQPTQRLAYAVNASATGLLIDTAFDQGYRVGAQISVLIPHMNSENQILVKGQIVRTERFVDRIRIAVNLID